MNYITIYGSIEYIHCVPLSKERVMGRHVGKTSKENGVA
jgi:hypothetical protein